MSIALVDNALVTFIRPMEACAWGLTPHNLISSLLFPILHQITVSLLPAGSEELALSLDINSTLDGQ